MRVKYIKDGFGHVAGTVIDTTPKVAGTLLRRGICEKNAEKANAADQVDKALDALRNVQIESMEYIGLKQLVSTLAINTADQKKATLIEALNTYKASLGV